MITRRSFLRSIALCGLMVLAIGAEAPAQAKEALVTTNGQGQKMAVDVYGSGPVAVVLAHQMRGTRTEWSSFAKKLEKAGYAAYTFDFNGYGKFGGSKNRVENHKDVLQMVSLAKSRGAQRVYLVGSSMGAAAVLKAGLSAKVDGVVAMAPYVDMKDFASLSSAEAKRLRKKTLLFSAEKDSSYSHAQKLDGLIPNATFYSYKGSAHGMALLKGKTSKEVTSLLLTFLR